MRGEAGPSPALPKGRGIRLISHIGLIGHIGLD
jgi:hypothetical protein